MSSDVQKPRIINSQKTISRLLAVARRAKQAVPYYQSSFAGIDLASPSLQLTDLPMLTKEAARSAQEALVKPEYLGQQSNTVIQRTSGSTGIPLRLIRTHAEVLRGALPLWQARAAIFPDVLESLAVSIYPYSIRGNDTYQEVPGARRKGQIISFSTQGWHIDHMASCLDRLDYLKPAWLFGPPALLSILAEALRRSKRRLHKNLVFVESNSDWLSPETRNLLAETFNCRIANQYGSQETYTIAYECSKGTMHLFEQSVVVELHPCGDREENELVVSSLIFEAMPFIRYRLGDFIQMGTEPCLCGNTTPVLGYVRGRVGDVIAGTALHGGFVFFHVITWLTNMGIDTILQYTVHQTALNHFVVQLHLKDPSLLKEIGFHFQDVANVWLPHAQFSFEAVDQMALTPGGKIQSFIRHI
ncbi:MAG TPA: AMP-binding protein [Ktedonosporobacter sp.]|nr:AMP-binding protein [Ktedonosporobacter sp.]